MVVMMHERAKQHGYDGDGVDDAVMV